MKVHNVHAERIHESGRCPKTYATGRVCRFPGCDTLLSQYNKAEMCMAHEKEVYSVPCKHCGAVLPFTDEFFWRTRHGLLHSCKECQGFKVRHHGTDCNFGEVTS